MDWMRHFQSVIDFVEEYFLFVIGAFLLACIVELIVFIAKRDYDGVNWKGFFVAVVTNIFAILGLYIIACICVGTVNFVAEQDLHFVAHFYTGEYETAEGIIVEVTAFTSRPIFGILCGIVAIAGFIFMMVILSDMDAVIVRVILSGLAAALATIIIMYGVAFLLYVIFAFIWFLLKTIFFVVVGVAISIWQFFIRHWREVIAVMVTPGLIYGLVRAFWNYIKSLREEVFDR